MSCKEQVPSAIKAYLQKIPIADDAPETLDALSEQLRSLYFAGHISSKEHSVARVRWGIRKLAEYPGLDTSWWRWLCGIEPNGLDDKDQVRFLWKRVWIFLMPAASDLKLWRANQSEIHEGVEAIKNLANELKQHLHEQIGLNVSLDVVIGTFPELTYNKIKDSYAGAPYPIEHVNLSNFLDTLISQLDGNAKLSGMTSDGARPGIPLAPFELSPGADFGAYPKRGSALRRAVIKSAADVIVGGFDPPPPFSAGALIEAICMAWFGESPAIKEINALIKPIRDKGKGLREYMST